MNDAMDGGSDALDVNSIPDELLGQEVGRYMSLLDQALVDARPDALVAGHIVALVTAMNVLKRLPGFNSKMVALQDLLVRLDKLRAGQKKPMMNLVNSVKTPGRPSASRTDHAEEVRAVSVVQALIDRGWDQKDAVKLVANTMAKLGRKGQRGQPITPRAVADWLDKIKANDPIYRMAMQAFAERGPVDLSRGAMEKIARDILSSGAKTYD